ncbi:hypothetical protein WIW49_11970 [Xanthomonas euroxanthea]
MEKGRALCKRSNALCTHGIDCLPDRWLQHAIAACKRAYRKGADRDENGRPVGTEFDPHDRGPTELEFDVPALPDDATPPVFIGVRITGVDPTAVSQSADRLISAGVSAELHLERIEPSGPVSVELQRSQRVGVGQQAAIPLSADGMAPGLFAFDADGTTLQDAGLSTEQTASRELAFGYSNAVQPGRYRLKLRFDQNAEALVAANAQLLVAYTYKGK